MASVPKVLFVSSAINVLFLRRGRDVCVEAIASSASVRNGQPDHVIGCQFARKTGKNLVNKIVWSRSPGSGRSSRKIRRVGFEAGYRPDDSQKCRKNSDLEDFLAEKCQNTKRKWSGAGSNRRHRPFQGRALPTELPDLGALLLPL